MYIMPLLDVFYICQVKLKAIFFHILTDFLSSNSTNERGLLKSPIMIAEQSTSPFYPVPLHRVF